MDPAARASRALPLLALLLALHALGCGYKVVHYRGRLGDVQTVAISGLANESFEPGIDGIVSDALATEFLRRGALQLVDDEKAADLVVHGAVVDVRILARSFSSVQFSLEYAVTVRLRLDVKKRDGTALKLDERSLQETELYFASADVEATRKNREEAERRVAAVLAGRLFDSLFARSVP